MAASQNHSERTDGQVIVQISAFRHGVQKSIQLHGSGRLLDFLEPRFRGKRGMLNPEKAQQEG
jgi:hypothetical protein